MNSNPIFHAIPYDFNAMTKADAFNVLVDLDTFRWGETEYDASVEMHRGKSRGRLINSIAHHVSHDHGEALSAAELLAAQAQLSADDRMTLSDGG
jgi:hypothetical protein